MDAEKSGNAAGPGALASPAVVAGDGQLTAALKRPAENGEEATASALDSASSPSPSAKRAKLLDLRDTVSESETSASEEGEIDEGSGEDLQSSGATSLPNGQQGSSQHITAEDMTPSEHTRSRTGENLPNSLSSGLYLWNGKAFELPSLSISGAWSERIITWAIDFVDKNVMLASSITSALVAKAFFEYMKTSWNQEENSKKAASKALRKAKNSGFLERTLKSHLASLTTSSVVSGQQEQPVRDSGILAPGDADDDYAPPTDMTETMANDTSLTLANGDADQANGYATAMAHNDHAATSQRHLPSGEDALEQQRRYFPSAADPTDMCLLCGGEGHPAAICSNRVCKFCHVDRHWAYACPSRIRCGKCRQLGHDAAQCEEKLALTKDEGLVCAFCNAPDHLENECTEIWRSFHPETTAIRTVGYIQPSCAICGSSGHYAADCRNLRERANPTWSLANSHRYVDTNCADVTIEVGAGQPQHSKVATAPGTSIRGRALRPNQVHYSESDDSEVEFLGNKPVEKPPIGRIRFSSNIQFARGASEIGRPANQQPPQQPPLPPGPPHPGPPGRQRPVLPPPPSHGAPSFGRPHAAPPPHSLPPRPPAGGRDYRNVPPPPSVRGSRVQGDAGHSFAGSRGGKGKRGGRGGQRGRGRGGK